MGHIHSNFGQHDFTASAFIVRTDFNEPRFMVHKHKTIGKYLQFGGHVELDETPWQTIIHELREEVGYDIDQLRILQPKNSLRSLAGSIVHPVPVVTDTHKIPTESDHYHTDIGYVLITDQKPRHKPVKGESTDIKVLTLREVKSLKSEAFLYIPEIYEYIHKKVLGKWEIVNTNVFEG